MCVYIQAEYSKTAHLKPLTFDVVLTICRQHGWVMQCTQLTSVSIQSVRMCYTLHK